MRSTLTKHQIIMLQKLTATILHRSQPLRYLHQYTSRQHTDIRSCYMLKLAAKFGFVSDLLNIAVYYYKTFRHKEALSIIEMTKGKLAQPGLIFMKQVDPERYTEAVGGQSCSAIMRQTVAHDIDLYNYVCNIEQLALEHQSASQKFIAKLIIPPSILLHMLEFLCCRHVDPMRAQAALDDLQDLVHHDQGELVHPLLRKISWEILGICQQVTSILHLHSVQ